MCCVRLSQTMASNGLVGGKNMMLIERQQSQYDKLLEYQDFLSDPGMSQPGRWKMFMLGAYPDYRGERAGK